MSISNYTALVIETRNDIKCFATFDKKTKKYVGWVTYKHGLPLLDSGPIYKTEKEALETIKKLIKEIRSHKKEHIKKLSKEICNDAIKAGIKDGSYK
jgi:hypothetical protein